MDGISGSIFNANAPIYLQIIADMKHRIASGELQAGQRLDSVRELAVAFNVNPNTMQRSLSELERNGLLHSERTSGRFITKDEELIRHMREEEAMKIITEFINQMTKIGCRPEEILSLLNRELQKGA